MYDLATDLWSIGPTLPEPRMEPTVERVGDRVVVAGGPYDGPVRDDAFVLEPGVDTWSTVAPLSIPRRDTASVVHDGQLFAFCGLMNGGERFDFTETVERYDPESDRWDRRPGLPTSKAWAAATTVDDRAFVVGGALRIANGEYLFLDEIHEADLSP